MTSSTIEVMRIKRDEEIEKKGTYRILMELVDNRRALKIMNHNRP